MPIIQLQHPTVLAGHVSPTTLPLTPPFSSGRFTSPVTPTSTPGARAGTSLKGLRILIRYLERLAFL